MVSRGRGNSEAARGGAAIACGVGRARSRGRKHKCSEHRPAANEETKIGRAFSTEPIDAGVRASGPLKTVNAAVVLLGRAAIEPRVQEALDKGGKAIRSL